MPRYTFQMVGETEPQHLYLVDDDAAWCGTRNALRRDSSRYVKWKTPPGADGNETLDEGGQAPGKVTDRR